MKYVLVTMLIGVAYLAGCLTEMNKLATGWFNSKDSTWVLKVNGKICGELIQLDEKIFIADPYRDPRPYTSMSTAVSSIERECNYERIK